MERLLLHNYGFIVGGFVNIALAIFVLLKVHDRRKPDVIVFVLLMISIATFQFSHVFGIMAANQDISRSIFMFNLADIWIGIFMSHWFLLVSDRIRRRPYKWILGTIYATGIALFIFYLANPSSFLLPSIPKLYFPLYYEAGKYYYLMVVWFFAVGIYYLSQMYLSFKQETDPIRRNRYKYVLVSILYGFVFGPLAFFLVMNIPIDPIFSMPFGIFTIPLAYTMIEYELFDLTIIAKRAVLFGVFVAVSTMFIVFVSSSNQYIITQYPGVPSVAIPLLASLIGVIIGVATWQQIRENDVLKSEFIDIITHKFRTPLTYIKWATENLSGSVPPQKMEELKTIEDANSRLTDLTNILAALSENTKDEFVDKIQATDIHELVQQCLDDHQDALREKKINLISVLPPDILAMADRTKLKWILDILIDNAISYTHEHGHISVEIRLDRTVQIRVTDSGIGMSKEDLAHLFVKFHRSDEARRLDTEGLGIGLFMARRIISRQRGTLGAESKGLNHGSTFIIELQPAKKRGK